MKTRYDRERLSKAEEKRERRRVRNGGKAKPKKQVRHLGLLIDKSEKLPNCYIRGYEAYDYYEPEFIEKK